MRPRMNLCETQLESTPSVTITVMFCLLVSQLQWIHVILTLYHSTFLIKMSCKKKTNTLLIITFHQLSYNLTCKIKEYQIISIDSIYLPQKKSLSLTTLPDFDFLLVKYHHISSSITLLGLTLRLYSFVEITIQIK